MNCICLECGKITKGVRFCNHCGSTEVELIEDKEDTVCPDGYNCLSCPYDKCEHIEHLNHLDDLAIDTLGHHLIDMTTDD